MEHQENAGERGKAQPHSPANPRNRTTAPTGDFSRMGHSDSSAHVSGDGGVCAGNGRLDEVAAAARRDALNGARLQGLKPPSMEGFSPRRKPRPAENHDERKARPFENENELKLRPPNNPFAIEIVRSAGKSMLLLVVRIYQVFLSPFFGGACKFYPSCSRYGYEAIAKHGACCGSVLAVKRLLRCRPFTKGGFDPVPDVVDGVGERELQGLKPHCSVGNVAAEAATHKDSRILFANAAQRKPFANEPQGKQEFAQ